MRGKATTDAMSKPERAHEMAPENVLKSELVKEDGNTKVVDIVGRLEVLPPGAGACRCGAEAKWDDRRCG